MGSPASGRTTGSGDAESAGCAGPRGAARFSSGGFGGWSSKRVMIFQAAIFAANQRPSRRPLAEHESASNNFPGIVFHQIFQCFSNGDRWFPSRELTALVGVANLHRDVDRPNELGINFFSNAALKTGQFQQEVEDFPHGEKLIAAHVVGLARGGALHQEVVSAAAVANVHHDSFAGERADLDHRLLETLQDAHELINIRSDGKRAATARTRM